MPGFEVPGFEAVFAIAGLMAIAYLVLRRRRLRPCMSAFLVTIMLASVLTTVSAAGAVIAMSSETIEGVVLLAVIGIAMSVILVAMWIAKNNKVGPPFGFAVNSVSAATVLVMIAVNARYLFLIKSRIITSPQNLVKNRGFLRKI